ncbi:DnaA regulatory inactivator Hda [Usitatibacter palustris]|uniref:DnaA regulatory inactivator Hda n=1 Tax=Usitatibacter palustris TaxID=2732487 RepID=A0A6M4H3V9_9PROT|nr:DnaA regulatory inactivator Hda [Usitatibacter palustris]QJR14025.1 DnaA regulatory inactivator Hda [Usitatibacter palustris]
MKQLLLDFTEAPAPTFANFAAGRNGELLAALDAAVKGQNTERVLYVWGESGAGKTHLLRAFAEATASRHSRYVRAADFDGAIAPVLVLDDIEQLPEDHQVTLFNAFNERTFAFLLVSARSAPRDLALRRDLASRLATGLTYRALLLTDAEKSAALAAHAASRGFPLADEVRSYLLTHARRDMPSLIGALDTLDRYSIETGRPITVPLLKAALRPETAA